ncbi:MAG: hypothetical protein U0Q12_17370 [Vicinamibacterales bacterium]
MTDAATDFRIRLLLRRGLMCAGAVVLASSALAQTPAPKVCGLLPLADIERHFGGKAAAMTGSDNPSISTCVVSVEGHEVRLTKAPTGTPGYPATVDAGIQLAYKNASGPGGRSLDTSSFGSIGCFRMVSSRDATGKNLPKPVYETTCFQTDGGYLSLAAKSSAPALVSYDVVKAMLEKIGAGQKKS